MGQLCHGAERQRRRSGHGISKSENVGEKLKEFIHDRLSFSLCSRKIP